MRDSRNAIDLPFHLLNQSHVFRIMPHIELPQAEFKVRSDARLHMSILIFAKLEECCVWKKKEKHFQNAWDANVCLPYL